MKVRIPVSEIEVDLNANTIWVHGPRGNTPMRIQFEKDQNIGHFRCEEQLSFIDIRVEKGMNIVTLGEDSRED